MLAKFLTRKVWLFIIVLFSVATSFASTESFLQSISGKIKKNDSCTVVDDKFLNMPLTDWNRLQNLRVDNIIIFELRQDTSILYQSKSFSCKLNISIKYYTSRDQQKPTEINNVDLIVKYDTARGASFPMQSDYRFKNAYKVVVIVNSISSVEWGDALPAVFRITNQIFVERKYPFQQHVNGHLNILQVGNESNSENANRQNASDRKNGGQANRVGITPNTINQATINWDVADFPGASEYDVEWTYIDRMSNRGDEIANTYSGGTTLPDPKIAEWMKNDNTRVTISNPQYIYTINLPFADGFILSRVRGVNYTTDDPALRQTTDWQYGSNPSGTQPAVIPIGSYQPNLNWQYNASYAEEGKHKEVISYFDGSLRSRQMVTINNTDNIAVVAETIYDNMGRPTMSILPAPINENKLDFYPAINKNTSGQPYSHTDIISASTGGATCTIGAGALNTVSGASNYYSANNPFLTHPNYYFTKYVPDAQQYPFTTTQYTPDNTGRIRRQGGVGPNFQIGSGHDTRYFYSKPFPRDLERLFGMEVGNASHYQKNMVIDANGQISVSYVDANGKTIATALAGSAPETVSALPSAQSTEAKTRLDQTLMQPADFSVDAGNLFKQASGTFVSAVSGNFTLNYSVDPAALVTTPSLHPTNSPQFCTNCYYDIRIDVKNECGMSVPTTPFVTSAFSGTVFTCSTDNTPFTGSISFPVAIGEYTVTYTLELSKDVINSQVDYYVAHNSDLKTIQDFFHEEFLNADLSGCYNDCATCMVKLGSETDFTLKMQALLTKLKAEKYADFPNFDANSSIINELIHTKYTDLYNTCRDLQENCRPESPCEQKLKMLKYDVLPQLAVAGNPAPSGYALYTKDVNGIYSIYERDISVLTHYLDPGFPDANFIDENGNPANRKSLTDESDFIKAYIDHPEWAEDFVKLHIEYCSYQWCKDQNNVIPNQPTNNYNEISFTFDEALRIVDNGRDAISKGFYFNRTGSGGSVNPYILLDQDKFFNGDGRGVSYRVAMKHDLDNFSDVLHFSGSSTVSGLATKNITNFVDWSLYCKPTDAAATSTDFINSWNSCPVDDACRSVGNEWSSFRDYYLQLKSKYVAAAKTRDWPSCTNCFIGSQSPSRYICKGDVDVLYGIEGIEIYEPGFSTNGTGTSNHSNNTEYNELAWAKGALKKASAWLCGEAGVDYSSVTFSKLVNFPTTGTYYVGLSGDNYIGFKLDNNLVVESGDLTIWKVYPITVTAGVHTITISASNTTGPSALGLIIYNNTLQYLLDPYVTEERQLTIVYTTENETGTLISGCEGELIPCKENPYSTLYEHKTRVFNEYLNVDAYSSCLSANSNGATPDPTLQALRAQLIAEVDESLKPAWFAQLQGVRDAELTFASITDAVIQQVVDQLAEVSKRYIAVAPNDNIRAASTLPSGVTTSNGFNSFHDVFIQLVGNSLTAEGFNENLLSEPYPFDKTPFAVNPNSGNLTQKIRDNFQRFKDRFQLAGGNPSDITALEQYAKDQLGDDYTFASSAEFADFYNRCAAGCNMLDNPILLPVAFATPAPASTPNTDHPNATCSRIASLTSDFQTNYPHVTAGTKLYRVTYTNYMNHQLGYSLSYSDYSTFIDNCNAGAKDELYNKPGSPYIPVDDFACAAGIIRNVFDRAGQEYEYYITQVRIAFRNAIVSKCLSGNATASVLGDQYEYHYTLYYYDQAGNLVKTIPPEGVKLLTDKEIDQVEAFKNSNPAATCRICTVFQTTNDKSTILQQMSTLLQSNSAKSLELWLNSTDGTSTRKVRLITPDSRYFFQAAIYNGKLWAELYSLLPDGSGGIDVTLSNQAFADISALPPLQPWTHLVVQTATGNLNGDDIKLYLDGQPLTTITTGTYPNYPFDWEMSGGFTLPAEDVAQLKHLRIYNRPATDAEIYANYLNSCLSPVGNLVPYNNPLVLWGRLNIPPPFTPGTNTIHTPFGYCVVEYANRFIVPDHTLPTNYVYNSQNQVVKQTTPDAGTSEFWYDHLGRLAASQNAEQKDPLSADEPANRYSYTRYDQLGRISEVGEKIGAGLISETEARKIDFFEQISSTPYPGTPWYLTGSQNRQVTVTRYDNSDVPWITTHIAGLQSNLRKRVAATALLSTANVAATDPSQNRVAATYYSYDIAGNVKHLMQENPQMMQVEQQKFTSTTTDFLKHIEYEYDLISGKVNKVKYQDGKWDQFYHYYEYDAENRLINSYSNRNNDPISPTLWKLDAHYRYYLHGPLARMELGKNYVQGVDYAYTLQGWLKGVNGTFIAAPGNGSQTQGADMSDDGLPGSPFSMVGRDVFAFSLGYYNGDYTAIGGSTNAPAFGLHYNAPTPGNDQSGQQLFNGNIGQATYAIGSIDGNHTAGYSYRYDQLNRLVATNRHTITGGAVTWGNSSIISAYREAISYDANGNIKEYLRNGADQSGMPLAMDNLTYNYNVDNKGRLANNQLQYVKDVVPENNYSEDIDDQYPGYYRYDRIGNLIADRDERFNLDNTIRWTVYGKIAAVENSSRPIIYGYDASGNRISKNVRTVTTFYTRDAQGNVMGIYENTPSGYQWKEQDLYGSSRLGMLTPKMNITAPLANDSYDAANDHANDAGNRLYELSNHLGNVMVTINDIKQQAGSVYLANIVTAQDYYPFGMAMPGRKSAIANQYRYAFNGKEKDSDLGEDDCDYGLRIYDPKIGRFLSSDPLSKEYPFYTPYQYAGNKPIWCIDLDGAEDVEYKYGVDFRNKFGEKTLQSYEKCIPYDSYNCHMVVNVPNGQPVTKNLDDKQVYRLAVLRILLPGQFKISENQYIDGRLSSTEHDIEQFLSKPITSNTPNTEYWRQKTSELQGLVMQGLFSDDNSTAELSIQQIKNRLSVRAWITSTDNLKSMAALGAGGLGQWANALGSSIPKTLQNLGIPKGFNIFADASKWRTAATNIYERFTMQEAISGQGQAIMGTGTNKALTDSRLVGLDITKYEYTKYSIDATGRSLSTTIHYLKNNATGILFDFKFTTPPR